MECNTLWNRRLFIYSHNTEFCMCASLHQTNQYWKEESFHWTQHVCICVFVHADNKICDLDRFSIDKSRPYKINDKKMNASAHPRAIISPYGRNLINSLQFVCQCNMRHYNLISTKMEIPWKIERLLTFWEYQNKIVVYDVHIYIYNGECNKYNFDFFFFWKI